MNRERLDLHNLLRALDDDSYTVAPCLQDEDFPQVETDVEAALEAIKAATSDRGLLIDTDCCIDDPAEVPPDPDMVLADAALALAERRAKRGDLVSACGFEEIAWAAQGHVINASDATIEQYLSAFERFACEYDGDDRIPTGRDHRHRGD